MSSADGYTISGLILGVIGVTGVIQMAWSSIDANLPSTKLNVLDEILGETDALFQSAVEDGLLLDVEDIGRDLTRSSDVGSS
jgi:hypothetical protein